MLYLSTYSALDENIKKAKIFFFFTKLLYCNDLNHLKYMFIFLKMLILFDLTTLCAFEGLLCIIIKYIIVVQILLVITIQVHIGL